MIRALRVLTTDRRMDQQLLDVVVMPALVPSLAAPESNDDGVLAAEHRLAGLRRQAAVVRTIADHVGELARPRDAEGLRAQLVEEMARLGCRLLEAAAALSESPRRPDSGILARSRT